MAIYSPDLDWVWILLRPCQDPKQVMSLAFLQDIPCCFSFLWCLRKPCHHPAAVLSSEGSFQCLFGLTELELAIRFFGLDFVKITHWTLVKIIRPCWNYIATCVEINWVVLVLKVIHCFQFSLTHKSNYHTSRTRKWSIMSESLL